MTGVKRLSVLLVDNYGVNVLVGESAKMIKAAKGYGMCLGCVDVEGHKGLVVHNPDMWPLLLLPAPPKTADEIATLAHEATHAVEFMFRDMGEVNRDEVFAHCVGKLVREVLTKVSGIL